jgi:hypothetical protein
VRIPVWLTLGVAALVIFFGGYRILLSFRSKDEDQRARARGGLFGMGRRTQFLIGVVYILLGSGLVATTFGWNPFGNTFGPSTEAPTKDKAPAKPGSVPIDQLPKAK